MSLVQLQSCPLGRVVQAALMPIRYLAPFVFGPNRLRIWRRKNTNSISQNLILPLEIWDIVFHELTDTYLLRAAAVCRAFNTLCISIYLARYNNSAESLASGKLSTSSSIIPRLQLSYRPEITQLLCHFWSIGVYEYLMSLRDLIKRSNSLREIILTFSVDVFNAYHFAQRTPYSQSDILRSFCTMLSTMAAKAPGPVFVAFPDGLFTCRAKDIASWRLDLFQFNSGMKPHVLIERMRLAFRSMWPAYPWTPPAYPWTTVRLHNGKTSSQRPLTKIYTVNVLSVQHDNGPGPFPSYSIVIFNISYITSISLYRRDDIPPEQWTAILPNLTLPALQTLIVATDGIEPTILGEFLVRHEKLRKFEYCPWPPNGGTASSIGPPIAHPSLAKIVASGVENTNRVMECLHRSPLLDSFSFSLHGQHTSIAELNPAFRLISQRSQDAHLKLDFWTVVAEESDGARTPFMDDEATDIARALQCILSVELSFSSMVVGLRTLSWLALFPGLRCATFHLHIGGRDPKRRRDDPAVQAELADFMREATASLPHVQEIDGDVR
ncbi:hypothetical protein FB451DRAFT_1387787 [Mycena latifolia]|nr:hypothetical protein FB451DRAFT_1387787 [Mycena latifolia]